MYSREIGGCSPWGEIQYSEVILRGVENVSTDGHGGYMVTKEFANKYLSRSAKKRSLKYNGYLCYEEDCDWAVLLFDIYHNHKEMINEFLRKDTDLDRFEKTLKDSLSKYHPTYLLELKIQPNEEDYKAYLKDIEGDKLRKAKSPNLIVGAIIFTKSVDRVTTADGKTHYVTSESYDNLRKSKGLLLLSECVIVSEAVAKKTMAYEIVGGF